MSNDLISREAFMDYLWLEDTEENREENVGEIVTLEDFDRQPIAFDKERVIEQIKGYKELVPERVLKEIIEIVEKGGIE